MPIYKRKAVNAHAGNTTHHHFDSVAGHTHAHPSHQKHAVKGEHYRSASTFHKDDQTVGNSSSSLDASAPKLAARGGGYGLVKQYAGSTFFDDFYFFTNADPSGGMIDYVDEQTARSAGLIGTKNGNAFIKIGYGSNGIHRAVRISTQDTFTTGIIILDAYHMPTGCGCVTLCRCAAPDSDLTLPPSSVWPAFWTTPRDPPGGWPSGGEIDLVGASLWWFACLGRPDSSDRGCALL